MLKKKVMKAVQKKATKATNAVDLRSKFLKLNLQDQQVVTNFFNLHNAAHFLYDLLSDQAKEYVGICIQFSQEADNIEKENDV